MRPGMIALLAAASLAACGGGGGGSSGASAPLYTISGTVGGLGSGTSLVLVNNGGDSVTVASNSSFSFKTHVVSGQKYNVTVFTQPKNQSCEVSNGSGTALLDVTNIVVGCNTTQFEISGVVDGLAQGSLLTLQNNGADSLTLNANSSFTFATAVPRLGNYDVTVASQPPGQTCTVSWATGGALINGVSNVIVECVSEVVLWSFGAGDDGAFPFGGLIQGPDSAFYGTTDSGGTNARGTLYKITTDGMETILWNFGAGGDGSEPVGALALGSDGNFYGTTSAGGAYGFGTVYKVSPTGTETVLWSFGSGNDGATPRAGLLLANDGNFYGTTQKGGTANEGTVFSITTEGTETVLWNFWTTVGDANEPYAPLIQASDGNLYGTGSGGGAGDWGTAFKITTAGVEEVLWSFIPASFEPSDGFAPVAPLIEGSDGFLYGTTYLGGGQAGAVVRLSKEGTSHLGYVGEESVLYSFGNSGATDGGSPQAALIIGRDGNFYGTTSYGGSNSQGGTAFKLTPSGIESVLWNFGLGSDGQNVQAPLLQASDGYFYGVSVTGGTNAKGTVFRIIPPSQ